MCRLQGPVKKKKKSRFKNLASYKSHAHHDNVIVYSARIV